MSTSSKTPPAEKTQKSVTGTGAVLSSVLADANNFQTTLQTNIVDQLHAALIFTADLDGKITSCSHVSEESRLDSRELVGRNITASFRGTGQQTPPIGRAIASVLDQGKFDGAFCCRDKCGHDVNVRLCLTLLRDSNGAPAGMIGFATEDAGDTTGKNLRGTLSAGPSPLAVTAVSLARRDIDGTQFVIASPLMHKFLSMVDRVAGHTETVLITGETGTGKELVARTIHGSSYRHKRTMIDINCAALPEHLVESELFGYEKGAFSGADSSKPGLFELADKSTIFLDEIGELQPQIQVKLLRVLDGAPYYRLGGNRKITVDVRVVAATNQDLELAVKEGRFRKDLFHRLGQFQLRVPPLRERPEDIAALARHFLSLKAADKSFTVDAMAALQAYLWPGNIRELRNLVAKLAMATDGRQITGADVAAEFSGEKANEHRGSGAVPLGNLNNMEEQMIIRALEQTGGHRAQAAEQLGISRRTLSRKLREYEIDVPPGEGAAKLGTISQEQQKFFRSKVNLSVTLKNAGGKELQVQAVNLSTGGLGLDAVADAAGFGGLVDVSFLLPETETMIQAKSRLVWADAGGRAGLRFVVVEPALFEELQHWTNRKMKDEGWETPA
jgi:transcriptional regulator with PAS, ATPase and Fis domain